MTSTRSVISYMQLCKLDLQDKWQFLPRLEQWSLNRQSARGICQGCALDSAHQYPPYQLYTTSDRPHNTSEQYVVDAFTYFGIGCDELICAHIFSDLAS